MMGRPKPRSQIYAGNWEWTRQTLYRHVSPAGSLREDGRKLLKIKRR
jgi:hypothetical protein